MRANQSRSVCFCVAGLSNEIFRALKDSFPGLQRIMAQLSDAERELARTEIERQLGQFQGSIGFEVTGEVLTGVGTK